jgi:hypothetical protein
LPSDEDGPSEAVFRWLMAGHPDERYFLSVKGVAPRQAFAARFRDVGAAILPPEAMALATRTGDRDGYVERTTGRPGTCFEVDELHLDLVTGIVCVRGGGSRGPGSGDSGTFYLARTPWGRWVVLWYRMEAME